MAPWPAFVWALQQCHHGHQELSIHSRKAVSGAHEPKPCSKMTRGTVSEGEKGGTEDGEQACQQLSSFFPPSMLLVNVFVRSSFGVRHSIMTSSCMRKAFCLIAYSQQFGTSFSAMTLAWATPKAERRKWHPSFCSCLALFYLFASFSTMACFHLAVVFCCCLLWNALEQIFL